MTSGTAYTETRYALERTRSSVGYLRTHAVELMFALGFVCQVALLSGSIGQVRVLVRMALFGASIALFIALRGRGAPSPAVRPAKFILAIVALAFFNPDSNTLAASIAQIGMYVAILAPLFWVPRLSIDMSNLRRVLLMVWIFQSISAMVGILQVYYPGQFTPAISTVILNQGKSYVKALQFQNAYGQLVFRAMGLSDIPGGAGAAGFYAALFGAAFMLTRRNRAGRILAIGTMVVGLAAIFLSHVRASLVTLIVCAAVLTAVLAIRRARVRATRRAWRSYEAGTLTRLLVVIGVVAFFGFTWALAVGGNGIATRFATLTASDPGTVYHQNRGHFIETSIEDLLPQYPLGAGLGRWGMMNHYFGDNSDPRTAMIWSEEQFTAWLVDGGVPLILVYLYTIAVTTMFAFRLSLKRVDPELAILAAVICAYDVGAVVSSLGYPFFGSQMGMEFWMLNSVLFAAAKSNSQARPDQMRDR
ncbi:MAG: O-antigen ligase family protein [Candidatus Binatus sp.]